MPESKPRHQVRPEDLEDLEDLGDLWHLEAQSSQWDPEDLWYLLRQQDQLPLGDPQDLGRPEDPSPQPHQQDLDRLAVLAALQALQRRLRQPDLDRPLVQQALAHLGGLAHRLHRLGLLRPEDLAALLVP